MEKANDTANLTANNFECEVNTTQVDIPLFLSCTCLSLLVCLVAFIIYIFIRKKMLFIKTSQPDRDTTKHWIHFNFILSFILRDVTIVTTLFLLHAQFNFSNLQARTHARTAFHVYAVIANFYWMFLEGFWLFVGVSFPNNYRQFSHMKIKTCLVGWLTPAVLVSIWTVSESIHPHTEMGNHFQEVPGIICILAPIYAILLLNLGMMIKVLRRLKDMLQSEQQKRYRLVRATVLLSFLLGMNFMLSVSIIPFLSRSKPCVFQVIGVLNDAASALQGFFVAVFYVLRNEEILNMIKRRIPRGLLKKRGSHSRSGSQQSRSGSQQSRSGSRLWSILGALTLSTRASSSSSDVNGNTYQPCNREPESDNPNGVTQPLNSVV